MNPRTITKSLGAIKGAVIAAPTAGSVFYSTLATVGAVSSGPAILAAAVLGAGAYAGYKCGSWLVGDVVDVLGLPKR